MDDVVNISLGDKIINMRIRPFDTEIDIDELLQIQHYNLYGEIISIPVLMNKVGILRAEMEDALRREKFDLEILRAQTFEYYRKNLGADYAKSGKSRPPSKETVENAVLLDAAYQLRAKKVFRVEKEFAYIDSLYWAVKDKAGKLNRLAEKLTPQEFEKELVESSVNMVFIRKRKPLIDNAV